jgi:hypothetical protein
LGRSGDLHQDFLAHGFFFGRVGALRRPARVWRAFFFRTFSAGTPQRSVPTSWNCHLSSSANAFASENSPAIYGGKVWQFLIFRQ